MSPLAYLARYTHPGQHRAGRLTVGEHLARDLEVTRARLTATHHDARARARRNHPAGRRLTTTGALPA